MLTNVDKMKIIKYIRENPLGEIYYVNMCEAIGKVNKIKDTEFLDFFVNYVIKEFSKSEKIGMNMITKVVSVIISFVGWIHDDNLKINEELLDKLRCLSLYYQEYVARTGIEVDIEFKNNYLDALEKKVNAYYPSNNNESVLEYLKEIDTLKHKLNELNRNLETITKNYEALKKDYDKKSQSLVSSNSELANLKVQLAQKEKTIEQFLENIRRIESKVDLLEEEARQLGETNNKLLSYKEKALELSNLVEQLRECVVKYEVEEQNREMHIKTTEAIKVLLYQHLLAKASNINDLMKDLNKAGYVVTKEEVHQLIKELGTRINIVRNCFADKPEYSVLPPNVVRNGTFDIKVPEGTKYYDIFLAADFQIREMNSGTIKRFDKINNYCIDNNINLVLNLGDLFEGKSSGKISYDDAMTNISCVEKAISLIPKTDSIYYAVIGGNHDEKMFKFGLDPIGMLADEREDFINLGYEHCTITFNGSRSLLTSFAIHHPFNFDYNIHFNEDGLDSRKTLEELESFYKSQGRTRADSYIDIFGHMHKCLFNYPDSYYFLPAFMERLADGGACHLRVYFTEDMKIKYMLFMPLSLREKLVKNGEILYKKVLIK